MLRPTLTALLVLGLSGSQVSAQTRMPNEWVRFAGARSRAEGRSIFVERGLIHLSRLMTDGVVEFDYRALDEGSEADLWIRGMFNEYGRVGYQFELLAGRSGRPIGGMRPAGATLTPVEAREGPQPASGDGWRRVVATVRNFELSVTIDGVTVVRAEALNQPTGYLGFATRAGKGIEIRDLRATKGSSECGERAASEVELQPTVTRPELLREVRPVYTEDAVRRKIQGAVLLSAVIGETGAVSDLCVVKSLHEDLDESALAHARFWLFKPAMRDVQPVAMRVQLQMDFKLLGK